MKKSIAFCLTLGLLVSMISGCGEQKDRWAMDVDSTEGTEVEESIAGSIGLYDDALEFPIGFDSALIGMTSEDIAKYTGWTLKKAGEAEIFVTRVVMQNGEEVEVEQSEIWSIYNYGMNDLNTEEYLVNYDVDATDEEYPGIIICDGTDVFAGMSVVLSNVDDSRKTFADLVDWLDGIGDFSGSDTSGEEILYEWKANEFRAVLEVNALGCGNMGDTRVYFIDAGIGLFEMPGYEKVQFKTNSDMSEDAAMRFAL